MSRGLKSCVSSVKLRLSCRKGKPIWNTSLLFTGLSAIKATESSLSSLPDSTLSSYMLFIPSRSSLRFKRLTTASVTHHSLNWKFYRDSIHHYSIRSRRNDNIISSSICDIIQPKQACDGNSWTSPIIATHVNVSIRHIKPEICRKEWTLFLQIKWHKTF